MIDATNVTLLPCPFCGGEAMLMAQTFSWEVHCLPCTASVSEETQPEAIAAWNTRTAAEAASKAEIAELAQALANHNDVLRSAYQIAARKGRDTEWDGFTKRAGSVLHFHHDEVERARALLAKHQTEGRGA